MENKKEHKMIFTLGLAAAFFLLVFVLVEFRENYLAIGATGVLLLVSIYFYLRYESKEEEALIREEEESTKRKEEYWNLQMQEFQKIGKAIYTAVKKNGMAVEESLVNLSARVEAEEELLKQMTDIIEQQHLTRKQMEESTELLEQIYSAAQKRFEVQKNGLKAVIKYNKENARQIAEVVNNALTQLDNDLSSGFQLVHEEFGVIKDLDLSSIDEKYEALSQVVLENTVTVSDNLQKINDHVDQVGDLLKDLQSKDLQFPDKLEEMLETPEPLYTEQGIAIDKKASESDLYLETDQIPLPEMELEDTTKKQEENEILVQVAAAEQMTIPENTVADFMDSIEPEEKVEDSVTIQETPADVEGLAQDLQFEETTDVEGLAQDLQFEETTDVEGLAQDLQLEEATDVVGLAQDLQFEEATDVEGLAQDLQFEEATDVEGLAQDLQLEEATDVEGLAQGIQFEEEPGEIKEKENSSMDFIELPKQQEIKTEPVQTEAPVSEPASMADANQKMTPEQIAALIASLNN